MDPLLDRVVRLLPLPGAHRVGERPPGGPYEHERIHQRVVDRPLQSMRLAQSARGQLPELPRAACFDESRSERAIASPRQDCGLALASGVLLGAASWFGLRTELQFAGAHGLVATLTFIAVAVAVQSAALLLCAGVVTIAQRLSRVPRAVVVIPAAVAIHVAWRRLLERADGLALVSLYSPEGNGSLVAVIAGVMVAVLVVAAWRRARLRPVTQPN